MRKGQWVDGSLSLSTILYMRKPHATQLQQAPFALLLLHLIRLKGTFCCGVCRWTSELLAGWVIFPSCSKCHIFDFYTFFRGLFAKLVFSKCFRTGFYTYSRLKFEANNGTNSCNLCFKIKTKTYLVFISMVTIHSAYQC